MKILLVDDEKTLLYSLKEILRRENFAVDAFFDSVEAFDYLKTNSVDIIVLDIMMPKMDGFTFIKKLREDGNDTPIIVLSAKADIDNKLSGLELGADDYLAKPFSTDELIARIRAIVRRKGNKSNNTLDYHGLKLDIAKYTMTYGDKSIVLQNKEFQLLELFMLHPDKVYSSEELLNRIWGYDSFSDITSVWTFLSNLRRKINSLTDTIKIKSNRGLGYCLVCLEK